MGHFRFNGLCSVIGAGAAAALLAGNFIIVGLKTVIRAAALYSCNKTLLSPTKMTSKH